jgi:site-specific DNA-methyltransferase (adenine-specific)
MPDNRLYYGDNLDVLRRYIRPESVDLVYLDPPFNSNQDYNVLFAEQDGKRAAAQIKAFGDTWEWNTEAASALEDLIESGPQRVSLVMRAFRAFVGDSNMLAYLAMMAPRLVQLHSALKATGSLYLHCDPTASHYLKLLLDAVFGPENFRNEIIWKRYSGHGNVRSRLGSVHDTILFYTKTRNAYWSPQYGEYDGTYVEEFFRHTDANGRRYRLQNVTNPNSDRPNLTYEWNGHTRVWKWTRERFQELHDTGRLVYSSTGFPSLKQYLDESKGPVLQDLWTDIRSLQTSTAERLGYPTQKPEALLERIIRASCPDGGTVLDPFCGCGTTVAAAQKLGRQWIGIDITHLAIGLIRSRLRTAYGAEAVFKVVGEPVSLPDAHALAGQDRYQFQWWALGLAGARPAEQKKGPDRGVDGRLFFHDEAGKGKSKQIIFSVKSGTHVGVKDVRELSDVVRREDAQIGVLITLAPSTKPMRDEAASGGFYKSSWGSYPRLQILTVEELLNGARVDYPWTTGANVTFKQAPRVKRKVAEPLALEL